MGTYRNEILELIQPLFNDYASFGFQIKEATSEELKGFDETALKNGVPEKAIFEMKRFYEISNGIPCIDIDIHKASEPLIYEFWESKKQLWIGGWDMDLYLWSKGKFHLGDGFNLNYGEDYIFDDILGLLTKAFQDHYPASDGKYSH